MGYRILNSPGRIDMKSLVIGLFLGLLVILGMGAASQSNENGRYQITTNNKGNMIIDTRTGHSWSIGTNYVDFGTPQNPQYLFSNIKEVHRKK